MRLEDYLEHPVLHSAFTNVLPDDHHRRPGTLTILNNTQVIPPLPGGPGVWDTSVPYDTIAATVSLRSAHQTEQAGGMAGVILVVTRSSLEASSMSLGGHGTLSSASFNAIYAKSAAAMYLSHKIFSTAGRDILLREAHLPATGPATRVLRLEWENLSAGLRTLDARGQVVLFT